MSAVPNGTNAPYSLKTISEILTPKIIISDAIFIHDKRAARSYNLLDLVFSRFPEFHAKLSQIQWHFENWKRNDAVNSLYFGANLAVELDREILDVIEKINTVIKRCSSFLIEEIDTSIPQRYIALKDKHFSFNLTSKEDIQTALNELERGITYLNSYFLEPTGSSQPYFMQLKDLDSAFAKPIIEHEAFLKEEEDLETEHLLRTELFEETFF